MKPETKYKGSIKLSAIGDALGWMTEFEKSSSSLKGKFGEERIQNFHNWKKNVGGRFYGFVDNLDTGSYSDDTQLLLSVARSIKNDGSVDNNYFAKIELPAWLLYARGGGRTVKTAADKIQRKSVKWNTNFYNYKVNSENYDYKQSGANGAAMRILPIALANFGDVEKIKIEIFRNSIITHGHPRAILGAVLYGYAINQILAFRPENFTWDAFLTQIGSDFPQKFSLKSFRDVAIDEWLQIWNKSSNLLFETVWNETLVETQNHLRFTFQSIKNGTSVYETLDKLGCFAPATKGSGISTVVAGIFLAAKFHSEPLIAIIEAVNALGSDTDSIAAFTGGLVGALHGHSIIPDKWKKVQDFEYLDKIAHRLLLISEGQEIFEKDFMSQRFRNINDIKIDNFEPGEKIEFIPLGEGVITAVNRQPTLTKGKYNLLLNASFDDGQTILISKIFSDDNLKRNAISIPDSRIQELLTLANQKLNSESFYLLQNYLNNNKKISDDLINLFTTLIKN